MTRHQPPYHLAGEVFATTATAIGHALARLPGATIEISSEVEIEGEAFDIAIYPVDDAARGAEDFLVTGNLWIAPDAVQAFVRTVTDGLEHAGLEFELELMREGSALQVFRHPRRGEAAEPAPPVDSIGSSPDAWTVQHGRIVAGPRLQSGSGDEVRLGRLVSAPGERFLLTLTMRHAEPHDRIRARLALAFDGITSLEHVGAPDPGVPYEDVLVERLPAGEPAGPPLPEPALIRLGLDVAHVIARVHAAGQVIDGIRPELIYVERSDGEPRFSGLVPRGPAFIASAPPRAGIRSYHVPYFAPEQLLVEQTGPASDVFALCATLFTLGSGVHPFGDPDRMVELLDRLATGTPAPWPGSPALGDLLARGMSLRASDRPTAAALAASLASST